MAYKSLMKLFYMDASSDRFANNDRLAAERLGAESTFRTGMHAAAGELFIALPHELSVLSEQVLRKERIVQSLQAAIPPIARGALVRSLVIDEVVGTNDLEGIRSTRKQINELLESASAAEHVGQKRFRELAKLYLGLSGGNAVPPQSPEDIRAIYDQVMAGEDLGKNAPDGRLFRRSGVEVIGKSGDPIHEGAKTEAEFNVAGNISGLKLRARATGTLSNANLYNQALHQRLRPVLPAHRVPAVVLVHHKGHIEEVREDLIAQDLLLGAVSEDGCILDEHHAPDGRNDVLGVVRYQDDRAALGG